MTESNKDKALSGSTDAPKPVLLVEGVAKKFSRNLKRSIAYGLLDLGRNALGIKADYSKLRAHEFWALKDISFELHTGEILGIVGMNGAGKSTLLRVINGIYPPDIGRIEIRGRLGGLIALGAGFHPHLTGRENIFLNGAILGMNSAEIREKLDSIIEFSGVANSIDAPVSTYSSGMYVRLGFSIAIHCEPEILIIDEVLAVGDASFQNKCLRKIAELRDKARAILFVSHNLDMVEAICNRSILLDEGAVVAEGRTADVLAEYRQRTRVAEQKADASQLAQTQGGTIQTGEVAVVAAGILDESGLPTEAGVTGDDLRTYADILPNKDVFNPQFGMGFAHATSYPYSIGYDSNLIRPAPLIPVLKAGELYRLIVTFKKARIIPGVYRLNLMVRDGNDFQLLHHVNPDDFIFRIQGVETASVRIDGYRPAWNAFVDFETEWKIEQAPSR